MIYIVQGSTGEYSDRSEWNVRAFLRKEEAQDFLTRIEAQARVANEQMDNYTWNEGKDYGDWEFSTKKYAALVPLETERIRPEYGVRYWVAEVPFESDFLGELRKRIDEIEEARNAPEAEEPYIGRLTATKIELESLVLWLLGG